MTSVDRVKLICKEKKIPISRLEKELGFANGYIGQLKKGVFPDDRLVLISKYLGIEISELTGEQKEKPAAESGEPLPEITQKLVDAIKKLTLEQQYAMMGFIQTIENKRGEK